MVQLSFRRQNYLDRFRYIFQNPSDSRIGSCPREPTERHPTYHQAEPPTVLADVLAIPTRDHLRALLVYGSGTR
ncbi:hypothetical protein RB195_008598 [Necator americanus]|uniref:Uncharacterized protein n=1 Tax=Necator americanus TaxID=51031 RepID=A0ABR1CPE4_NECAM